ncbi:MAG: MEDS domain-containing protein [Thermohalobaculum sp.]|nr:MEDS domain-containing protein [Thermohalobaculum sp.]
MSADDDAGLLDIHEAARFLRVSEVSIRRYTNSGELPCLRVGGRRQRRFRRVDLERFLGMMPGNAAAAEVPAPGPAPAPLSASAPQPQPQWKMVPRGPARGSLTLEGLEIAYGSHLCQLYESERGRIQMALPFLADGLAEGDACFLVASEPSRAQLMAALDEARGGLAEDISCGRLRLLERATSGTEMLDRLERAFSAALSDGYRGLRLLGDMAWFLDVGMDSDELMDFELRYDRLIGHSYPVVSLCLYDARRFSGVELLHTLKCHSDTFSLPLNRFLLR